MTAYDPKLTDTFAQPLKGIKTWLGLDNQERQRPDENDLAPMMPPPVENSTRRDQMDALTQFLEQHDLSVNQANLTAAHAYLNGENPALASAMVSALLQPDPLTDDAIAALVEQCDEHTDQAYRLEQLMERLEGGMDTFTRASAEAREATSDYSHALEEHVDELARVSMAGAVISDLAELARVMLRRTRTLEVNIQRSEVETAALRVSLEEARVAAESDHLTGLTNRRGFERAYASEFRAALQNGTPLSIAICDVDRFKSINDAHGHPVGDRVLRLVAQQIVESVGHDAITARYGGDEFAVILRGTPLADAGAALDSVRERLAGRRLVNRNTEALIGVVTISAGIADASEWPDPAAAIEAADAALLEAKGSGRDRVSLAARSSFEDLPDAEPTDGGDLP